MALYVDIEKKYGDFLLKVKFEAQTDEVFAILGASGCGKSLTLKCIAGIEKPDKGIIRLDDRVLFDSEHRVQVPARKRKIGYLFQDYALFPNMTVLQNILCGANDREQAMDYIRRFCLEGKENLYPEQLSGGQKQRTALARMLAAQPEIIMLDEPFSALDNYLKTQMEREVVKVMEDFGRTVLFVSHDRNEVYRLTDRIAVMEEGQIVDIQPKAELFQTPRTLAAALLTGCKNVTELEREKKDVYYAADWGIYLKCEADESYRYAGFRAHYFQPVSQMEEFNVLECEVQRVIEDTFSMIVLFRHKGYNRESRESLLTYELPKESWEQWKDKKLFLKIPEDKIIWLQEEYGK